MIDAPSAYTSFVTDQMKWPIYGVQLTSPDGTTTHEIATSIMGKGGAFASASLTLDPIALKRSADPREGRFTVPTFTFQWFDTDDAATAAVATGLDGYTCELYQAFRGMDWGSYRVTHFKGLVSEIALVDAGYQITARSAITKAEKRLFEGAATKLNAAMDATQTTVVVEDASGFQDSGWFRISDADPTVDPEDIAYTGRTNNGNGTWTLSGLTRGAEGTTAAAHAADDKVSELFVLGPKHPFDLMEDILTGTGQKTGLEMTGWVNSDNLSAAKTAVGSTLLMYFKIVQGSTGKAFLENEILRPMAHYPFEDAQGRIGVRAFDTPTSADFVDTLTDGHMVERPIWSGMFERKVNSVTVLHDFDPNNVDVGGGERGRFDGTFTNRDSTLIDQDDKEHSLVIPSRGIDSSQTGTDTLLDERTQAYIDRFGTDPAVIQCRSILSLELLELGDPVFATFSDVISLPAATRSLTSQPAEIIRVRRDWRRNTLDFEILTYPSLVFTSGTFDQDDDDAVDSGLEDDFSIATAPAVEDDWSSYSAGAFESVATANWEAYMCTPASGLDITAGGALKASRSTIHTDEFRYLGADVTSVDALVEMRISALTIISGSSLRPNVGPSARCHGGASPGCYRVMVNSSSSNLLPNRLLIMKTGEASAGCPNETVLSTIAVGRDLAVGDVIGIKVSGQSPTTIEAYLNGSSMGSTTDSDAGMQIVPFKVGLTKRSGVSGGGVPDSVEIEFDYWRISEGTV